MYAKNLSFIVFARSCNNRARCSFVIQGCFNFFWFFAAYVIGKKNYSFSWVVFLFSFFAAFVICKKNHWFSRVIFSFFAAYVICKKNYSFTRVVFLFFFSPKIANSFHSKVNDSSWVRTIVSQAEGPGSSLCYAPYFYDFTDICQKFHFNGSHGTMGRTTGFWSGRFGFESQILRTFFNLHITTENRDTPLSPSFIHKLLRYRKLSETQHRRVPLRNVSVLWDKLSKEIAILPPYPLSYP